jgi:hypothetical protein
MNNQSITLVSADLLGESKQLINSILRIEKLLSYN